MRLSYIDWPRMDVKVSEKDVAYNNYVFAIFNLWNFIFSTTR